MPKSRSVSRRMKRKSNRRHTRRRGGAGASVNYHLSGSWPSRMSLGQGADYFKYHEGQHGGALGMGPYPDAVMSTGLPQALRGPAHVGGIDNAIGAIQGMCDPPNCPSASAPVAPVASVAPVTTGGNRKNRNRSCNRSSKRNSKHGGRRSSKHGGRRNRNTMNKRGGNRKRGSNRRRGGALGYAPFPSSGMLLGSSAQYAEAGLNPEWKTDVAFADAKLRESQ